MLKRLKHSVTLAGLSAAWMYLYDPDLGNRRRGLLRDQFTHLVNRIVHAYDVTRRDMSNRLTGATCEIQRRLHGREDNSDAIVRERVRTKLGRYASHPAAIETHVHDGRVTLQGAILASESQSVMNALRSVEGVTHVDNRLEVHASAGNIAALQGGTCPRGEPLAWMQENWSPSARFLAGVAGSTLVLNSMGKRTIPALFCGGGGMLLLARAISNQPLLSERHREERSTRSGRSARSAVATAPNAPAEENWDSGSAGSNVPQRENFSPMRLVSADQPGSAPEPFVETDPRHFRN